MLRLVIFALEKMINTAGYVMGLTFIISHVGHLNLEVMGDNNLTISLILAHG